MKFTKYIIPIIMTLILSSCSNNEEIDQPINEVQDLLKVKELVNDSHIVELFTEKGELSQGYNNITIRIKDKATNTYIKNAEISWKPIMHMVSKTHACPKSAIVKVPNTQTIYNGFIIFQMAENSIEGWKLTINYKISDIDYVVISDISVLKSDKKLVTVFTGEDDIKYVLALINLQNPEVKTNKIILGLFKMENMMQFSVVENFIIKLDPRMPSMDNHSSPNNQDLTYNTSSQMYEGNLSLTMTGYWKLNLMLYDSNEYLLKGEVVDSENESSSLFLELEF